MTDLREDIDALKVRVREAERLISKIEERFPNWTAYRDLLDCIDCEIHRLKTEAQRI